jgi:hypothetical protein
MLRSETDLEVETAKLQSSCQELNRRVQRASRDCSASSILTRADSYPGITDPVAFVSALTRPNKLHDPTRQRLRLSKTLETLLRKRGCSSRQTIHALRQAEQERNPSPESAAICSPKAKWWSSKTPKHAQHLRAKQSAHIPPLRKSKGSSDASECT